MRQGLTSSAVLPSPPPRFGAGRATIGSRWERPGSRWLYGLTYRFASFSIRANTWWWMVLREDPRFRRLVGMEN
jgi:hypothetical protein